MATTVTSVLLKVLYSSGRSSEMMLQLKQLTLEKVEQNERDEGQLESDLKRMGNYVLFMRNLLANGNDDEIMNMYDHLMRYVNDVSGRNPFWLNDNNQATPTVSLQSDAGDDVLDNSVGQLVTTCLGELVIPTFQANHFELVEERGKVFDVGKEVEVIIQSSNRHKGPPTPPDLKLFQAKVLTPKQTVIQAKLELHDDASISVRFTSYIPGRHRLAVQVEGNSLRGSPRTLEIKGEPDYSVGTTLLQKLPADKFEGSLNEVRVTVRIDSVGNIYILTVPILRVFDADFNNLYIFNLLDVMTTPWIFTVNSESQIVVSDTGSHKLFVFKIDGTFLHEIGSQGEGRGELKTPLGVTVDSYDNIAVCDAGNRRIQLFNPDTSFKCSFGDEQDGEMMFPVSIQFNSQGQIIVAESSLWFSSFPPLSAGPPGGFDAATAVECVKIFSRDGQVLQKFGEPGEGRGQFWAPITVVVDHCDHIWVADFTYGSKQVFDEKGNLKEVFTSEEKDRGAGWLSTMAAACNGAVLYISAPL